LTEGGHYHSSYEEQWWWHGTLLYAAEKTIGRCWLAIGNCLYMVNNQIHKKWDPSSSVDESPEMGRWCCKAFWDSIQLYFTIGKVIYISGGQISSLL
jgi:hypothetical protein